MNNEMCDKKKCCACRYDFAIADICMILKSPELWRCSECSADEDRRANEVDSDDDEIDEEEQRFIDACLNDDFETQKAMILKKIEDGRLRREQEDAILKIEKFWADFEVRIENGEVCGECHEDTEDCQCEKKEECS